MFDDVGELLFQSVNFIMKVKSFKVRPVKKMCKWFWERFCCGRFPEGQKKLQ